MQSTSAAAVPFVSMESTVERIQTIRSYNRKFSGTAVRNNRPFPNYLWPLFQSESWCSSFHMKISFHLHVNENKFSYERMSTRTRFEEEANGNSEMAYCTLCHTYSVKESVFFFNTSMKFLGSVVKRLSSKKLHSKKTTSFVLKKTFHLSPNCQSQ